MAARIKLRQTDETRAKIRTSQLINRLEEHVLGEVEMKPSQVTAALGLMRKTLPDLTAVDHSGEIEHTLKNSEDDLSLLNRYVKKKQQEHSLQ